MLFPSRFHRLFHDQEAMRFPTPLGVTTLLSTANLVGAQVNQVGNGLKLSFSTIPAEYVWDKKKKTINVSYFGYIRTHKYKPFFLIEEKEEIHPSLFLFYELLEAARDVHVSKHKVSIIMDKDYPHVTNIVRFYGDDFPHHAVVVIVYPD